MIKKTITYKGFDGDDITEDFYFNLSMAEITEKQLIHPEGYAEYLQRIVKEMDRPAMIAAFKDLILSSVGVRTADGKGFVKKGVAEAFEATEAFSALFMEVVTDAKKSAEFFNGVMPKELADKIQAQIQSGVLELPEPERKKDINDYTHAELVDMSQEELKRLLHEMPGNNVPKHVLVAMQARADKANEKK